MSGTASRGTSREQNLAREAYFSDNYFSLVQLASFAHQLHHIYRMRPTNALEIGLGNGFVSTYLKSSGIPVTTADINPALNPDIAAPLSELPNHVSGSFDLVICCEVLEHMPLDHLDENLRILRGLGKRLFLTLPNSNRSIGVSGIARIPFVGYRPFDLNFDIPYKHKLEGGPHFWEVGYNAQCSRAAIKSKLTKLYTNVRAGRFELNPYHIFFECE